jgi:hypothetical protein
MNCLILTQYLQNYIPLAEITNPNKQEYCARHGYDFHAQVGHYWDFGVPRGGEWERFDYQRIKLMYDILFNESLGKRYDVVWWNGVDTMILNFTQKIEDYLAAHPQDYLIGYTLNHTNNDSVFVRNTEGAKQWLEFLLKMEPTYRWDCWESQRAVINHQKEEPWDKIVGVVPAADINCFFMKLHDWPETTPGQVQKGSWLLHLPGQSFETRRRVFTSQEVKDLMVK